MEKDPVFYQHQSASGELLSASHQSYSPQHRLVETTREEEGKELGGLKRNDRLPPQQDQEQHQHHHDPHRVDGRFLLQEPDQRQAFSNQQTQQVGVQTTQVDASMAVLTTIGGNAPYKEHDVQSQVQQKRIEDLENEEGTKVKLTNQDDLGTINVANVNAASNPSTTKPIEMGATAPKNAPKRPRAKPGFGLRTSRTTICETGQKRRSCICRNSKLCNELMTKWAKVSPPDYHYVQLPKEHCIPAPPFEQEAGKMDGTAINDSRGSLANSTATSLPLAIQEHAIHQNNSGNTNMSDTDTYKNGFRYATLRNMEAKNPLPKDERVALCHYHPEVRPYLFWPKNTPSAQKYAIPLALAQKLGYDTTATKCKGFNAEKYCYAVPTYSFEDAKAEIGSVEDAFYDRVRQIKTNPTQFVRDLRQCEEELKELNKLRRRNAELLRKLDDRRRSIKRLRSILKVQPHTSKEVQQHQLVIQAASANSHTHTATNSNTVQPQYQQHSYQTNVAYHQQQQLIDPSQQQQSTTAVPQPLGQQNQHNQFFQAPPPTQEQQAIGIVVGGITQNNEHHQQQEQQHHWTYTQYNANTIGGSSAPENEQQHSQQQLQPTSVHTYDPTQHQQPVPSPMDDHNNHGSSFSYAQQLEAAMAAAVAAGFKDEQEGVVAVDDDRQQQHHQEHQAPADLVSDVVDLANLGHHGGFGGDHGDDDDIEDDDWSETEEYRQSVGGSGSHNHQRPRKWPRKTVILPPISGSGVIESKKKLAKSSKKCKAGNSKKGTKTTKSLSTKRKNTNTLSGVIVQRDDLLPSIDVNHNSPKKIRKL